MSRYILKARCETAPNFPDYLKASVRQSTIFPPDKLIVFVGDKDNITQDLSVFPTTGGLYTRQIFSWLNLDRIQNYDRSKLFLDYQNVTVTLDVELEAQTDPNLQYGTAGSTIPTGALAVNLGSKGFQFNTSNMINGDEWGKLIYYEPGGLGIGWAFDANSYHPYIFNSITNNLERYNLGMYLLGGLLNDVSAQTLISSLSSDFTTYPSSNFQIGRDQALLTQMASINRVDGPQGYWSVQPTNYDPSKAACGRQGGMIFNGSNTSNTVTPVFNSYSPFGFMCLSYPTALVTEANKDSTNLGWNLQFPSYGPSTQDGYMPTGNAISISPGSFFTKEGLEKLRDVNSNPSSPVVAQKLWTDYWNYYNTSIVHLQETRPFYIEAPLFNAPIAFNLIPAVDHGLSMLVPITRLYNGVYLYTPITDESGQQMSPLKLNSQGLTNEPNYFVNPLGTLQKWFTPKRVALTINMPFVRVDTALQASRFFNTPYMTSDYAVTVPLWLKFYFRPSVDDNGVQVSAFPVDTTASLKQIAAAGGTSDGMLLSFSARTILSRFLQVLNTYGIPKNFAWGLTSLEISKILVSCTTVLDFPRLYSSSFGLTAFENSPQGFILHNHGTKVFSRCGSSLSGGPPSDVSIEFVDLLGDRLGSRDENGVISAICDFSDVVHTNYGTSRNDYFNGTTSFVFSDSVSLRLPDENEIDMGGQVNITFKVHPFVNMPFSGEVLKNVKTGGPQIKNPDVSDGNIKAGTLATYANGWFNNLNPYSPDYLSTYAVDNTSSNSDSYPHLDYKLVDFRKRKIEVWFQIQVPIQIYTGEPFN